AATSLRRVEAFLERAGGTEVASDVPDAFAAAMDDDLGTPAAMAVLHDTVREGNTAAGSAGATQAAASVRAMLDVLGLNPNDFATTGGDDTLTGVVDVLVQGLLEERAQARADQDWARADAIRDRLKAAGVEIEDTPDGPKWSV
ncbi:MAG: DALR domain-containing protein, partial [Nocardioides sp.]